jgi:microcystin-dependent protein
MKPLNLDNRPCSPISSNCVIWQGPDIPCIKLCSGDTVSDVVFALATELCTILDQLDVTTYDLSCLGVIGCGPKDFQALIQLLIDKICEIQNVSTSTTSGGTGECPDCIVTIAPCFQTNGQTTMQLLDYVQMIGTRICSIIDNIADINASITDLYIRVEALENAPVPPSSIPSFTLGCQVGTLTTGSTNFINVILEQFINSVWCPFYATIGSISELTSAINQKCIGDSTVQLNTGTAFSTNPDWIPDAAYNTAADAINNIWVVLCDLYAYTSTIETTVLAAAVIPTGSVMPWAGVGSIPPTGWAFCDGQAISRTTYATLFSIVSTTYGSGDGSTTFNIPDLQQRIPVGQGTNAGGYNLSTLGATAGNVTVTLTDANLPTHTHDLSTTSFTATITGATGAGEGAHGHTILGDPNGGSGATQGFQLTQQPTSPYDAQANGWVSAGQHVHTVSGTASGTLSGSTGDGSPALQGTAHGNMQPFVIMRYIIKL